MVSKYVVDDDDEVVFSFEFLTKSVTYYIVHLITVTLNLMCVV